MAKKDEKPKEEPEEVFVDDQVLEILRESLKQKLKKERKSNRSQSNAALKATLQEFMTCGKLFGYDLDGNVVEIAFSSSKLEESAMQNLFIQKFGEFMATRMNINDDF
jgi:hypothetical protein